MSLDFAKGLTGSPGPGPALNTGLKGWDLVPEAVGSRGRFVRREGVRSALGERQ